MEFAGKVAVVTGAASLIGSAIGNQLVAAGARVVLGDLDEKIGGDVDSQLGESARFVQADVTRDADLDTLIETAVTEFGGLDFLVSAAAVFIDAQMQTTREPWHHAFDVNVISAAMLIEKAVPHMTQRGRGAVVIIASVSAKHSQPNRLV